MAKNPVIQKAKQEGYEKGFEAGMKMGFKQGQYQACMALADKFEGLDEVSGIGPKILEKIVRHFGSEYFKEVEDSGKQA